MTRSGFTLIEVIVSTGIIVVMLAIGLPAFSSFQKHQNVTLAAESVRDAILEAYNYSLAPRAANADTAGKVAGADYYRVVFLDAATPQGYEVQESASARGVEPRASDWTTVLRKSSLPAGVVYCGFTPSSVPGSAAGIIYSISKGGAIVDTSGKESYQPVTIKLRHLALPNEVRVVSLKPETGQVSITSQIGGCS